MSNLGSRLMRAGLLTRGQLAHVGSAKKSHPVEALLVTGVAQDALAGFLIASGFEQATVDELEAPSQAAVRFLQREDAVRLMCLPLELRDETIVVAMADPSDGVAVNEVERRCARHVTAKVAVFRDILHALEGAYPERELEVVPLRQRKPAPGGKQRNPKTKSYQASRLSDEAPSRRTRAYVLDEPVDELGATAAAPPSAESAPPSAEDGARAIPKGLFAGGESKKDTGVVEKTPRPRKRASQSSATLMKPTRPSKAVPAASKSAPVATAMTASTTLPRHDSAPWMNQIAAATERDEVVRIATLAASSIARSALFLAIHKDVLKGWSGQGAGLSERSVRNLWIPVSSPSVFHDVLARGAPYEGPHGRTAADNLFRAAVSGRAGRLAVHPIVVGDRTVALLCVDGIDDAPASAAFIAEISQAVGRAFTRILSSA